MATTNDRSEAFEAYRRFAQGSVAFDLESDSRPEEAHTEVEEAKLGEPRAKGAESRPSVLADRAPLKGNPDSTVESSPTVMAFGLLSLLSEPEDAAPVHERLRCFELVLRAVEERRPLPVGAVLERFVRGLSCIRLVTQEAPGLYTVARDSTMARDFAGSTSSQDRPLEWLDLALATARSPVQFIPVSVFTRRFFRDELPSVTGETSETDEFHYHPENDKAIWLRERFSELDDPPISFQYFIDSSGLTEIVLDTETLDWSATDFAAALYCSYNGIPRATLDGIPVDTFGTRAE